MCKWGMYVTYKLISINQMIQTTVRNDNKGNDTDNNVDNAAWLHILSLPLAK